MSTCYSGGIDVLNFRIKREGVRASPQHVYEARDLHSFLDEPTVPSCREPKRVPMVR